jgi:hypothetical protein
LQCPHYCNQTFFLEILCFKENLPVCDVSTLNTFPVNIVVVDVFAVVVVVIIAVVVVVIIAVVGVLDEVWLQQIYDNILLRESR